MSGFEIAGNRHDGTERRTAWGVTHPMYTTRTSAAKGGTAETAARNGNTETVMTATATITTGPMRAIGTAETAARNGNTETVMTATATITTGPDEGDRDRGNRGEEREHRGGDDRNRDDHDPRGDRNAERREHLQQAIEHLKRAGLSDLADQLRRRSEAGERQRRLRSRRGSRVPRRRD